MNRAYGQPPDALSRRDFLRRYGIASSALTLSPFFLDRMTAVCQAAAGRTRVFKVKNVPSTDAGLTAGIAKLWQLLDGPAKYFSPTDIVLIKANAQWPNQGYTHTGCIKGVIDQILAIPGFSGEVLICDNIQSQTVGGGTTGFDSSTDNRVNNWPTMNWNQLAQAYQSSGKPVATVTWVNDPVWRTPTDPPWSVWNPASGNGWTRYVFNFRGSPTYLSYPVFQSPLTAGRMIDPKNGVWEGGSYTGRKVKVLVMPTLNNHSYAGGGEDYAGVTSAVKSFFGATEIYHGDDATWNGFYSMHSRTFTQWTSGNPAPAQWAGELSGTFLNTFYTPVLYITPAIYSGYWSRGQLPKTKGTIADTAVATNTLLACENPVSLDYVSCRDVISKVGSPLPTWLDPTTQDNNTWRQLYGCNTQGIGTLDPNQIDLITFDFAHPTASRLDIERKIRDFKAGAATEQDVKDVINLYMSNGS